jgi:hypothetical protein
VLRTGRERKRRLGVFLGCLLGVGGILPTGAMWDGYRYKGNLGKRRDDAWHSSVRNGRIALARVPAYVHARYFRLPSKYNHAVVTFVVLHACDAKLLGRYTS